MQLKWKSFNKKEIVVGVVGQPNVGKSSIINEISNVRFHVGNFAGVTVEKKEAFFEFEGYKFRLVDALPQ